MAETRCQVCLSEEREWLEELGQSALTGERSWRQAAALGGLKYHHPLKRHMEEHVLAPAAAEAEAALEDEMDRLIKEAKDGLLQQFYLAPPDVKPLILVAIQNLEGLRRVKPSQEALIKALKTVQEMTGMKSEQRLMLEFGKAMFGLGGQEPIPVQSTSKPASEGTERALAPALPSGD